MESLNQKKAFTVTKYPVLENLESSNMRETMKYSRWRQAMTEEFNALIRNGTWSLF